MTDLLTPQHHAQTAAARVQALRHWTGPVRARLLHLRSPHAFYVTLEAVKRHPDGPLKRSRAGRYNSRN
jgi:hypothetical protein